MRNSGSFDLFTIEVSTDYGVDRYENVRTFSADQAGTLHVHDKDGPLALYSPDSGYAARVVLSE